MKQKFDRRRKYYFILDCETATLPCARDLPESAKKKIAIAKPLIYDLGWQVIDRKGKIYKRKSFIISEIFSVPQIFNTAYYAHKRPIYLERLKKGETVLTDWNTAINELVSDMQYVEGVGAYNSMFDFKKAIPFTELYINELYSPDFHKWLDFQNSRCDGIAQGGLKPPANSEFDPEVFRFRGKAYPLFDLWGLSCKHILNTNEYKNACLENGWSTASGKYSSTTAENAFRFFTGQNEFDEAHTALDDAEIESLLFAEIAKRTKNKWENGIIYFPFQLLWTVERYCAETEKTMRWGY